MQVSALVFRKRPLPARKAEKFATFACHPTPPFRRHQRRGQQWVKCGIGAVSLEEAACGSVSRRARHGLSREPRCLLSTLFVDLGASGKFLLSDLSLTLRTPGTGQSFWLVSGQTDLGPLRPALLRVRFVAPRSSEGVSCRACGVSPRMVSRACTRPILLAVVSLARFSRRHLTAGNRCAFGIASKDQSGSPASKPTRNRRCTSDIPPMIAAAMLFRVAKSSPRETGSAVIPSKLRANAEAISFGRASSTSAIGRVWLKR